MNSDTLTSTDLPTRLLKNTQLLKALQNVAHFCKRSPENFPFLDKLPHTKKKQTNLKRKGIDAENSLRID